MLPLRFQQPAAYMFALLTLAAGQGQQCYFGRGAENRGPSELIPCNGTGSTSACCLQGDTCISGNACYNYATGNLYQYGCTDINYEDSSCPYKCGSKSPWVALEYCGSDTIKNTWVCHSPESCGCEWDITLQLLTLQGRQCQDMGDLALVGLYAPTSLAPWVSLPPTAGGSTGYYSPTTISGTETWVSTAVDGYTPTPITQLTTYKAGPSSQIKIFPGHSPGPATYAPAKALMTTQMPTGSESSGPSPTSTTTTTNSASTSAPASHLSTGAKAGIGVAAGLGGLVLLGAIAACIAILTRRSRRRSRPQPVQHTPSFSQTSTLREQPQYLQQQTMEDFGWVSHPSPTYQQHYAANKPGYAVYETPTAPLELANNEARVPQELDSDLSGISPAPSSFSTLKGSAKRYPS